MKKLIQINEMQNMIFKKILNIFETKYIFKFI